MSQSSAAEFLKNMKTDSTLADNVNNAADKDARWQVIREAGYSFTREELDKATITDLNHFERWSWEARLLADWL
ncbi:Nif11-like leader peptide family natural product precursor [Prosthecochloris sp. CIB 2401]|uniref:Nif11-like leader peptide family natural product precursor n=1 Tax=Prosthecochloris sp. CIB 2401 TaxID=1868325 RepID=UPI00080AB52E|nr:Nif11-like leader peptide family natural product precursor [Prosthecochloris sp. CIB 2401]ANT64025.1 nif11-like leader peptide domain protein [Prosthecochloris sp. CIB 2401]